MAGLRHMAVDHPAQAMVGLHRKVVQDTVHLLVSMADHLQAMEDHLQAQAMVALLVQAMADHLDKVLLVQATVKVLLVQAMVDLRPDKVPLVQAMADLPVQAMVDLHPDKALLVQAMADLHRDKDLLDPAMVAHLVPAMVAHHLVAVLAARRKGVVGAHRKARSMASSPLVDRVVQWAARGSNNKRLWRSSSRLRPRCSQTFRGVPTAPSRCSCLE